MLVTVFRLCRVETFETTVQPTFRQTEGLFRVFIIGIARTTFIESHNDIRPDDPLDIHNLFRGKQMLGAVDM